MDRSHRTNIDAGYNHARCWTGRTNLKLLAVRCCVPWFNVSNDRL
jgi:hypothetical protein